MHFDFFVKFCADYSKFSAMKYMQIGLTESSKGLTPTSLITTNKPPLVEHRVPFGKFRPFLKCSSRFVSFQFPVMRTRFESRLTIVTD